MVDWNEEEYKKLNQLVAERLPKHKYVSINGNHQHHLTLSLEYHVLMRGTGYTADDLRKLDSMMIRNPEIWRRTSRDRGTVLRLH
mmetsp:Transcript_26245/g.36092  ORF Transcript_26245/g.36092 Transcript_26245/m.36092 type:complete len:85 (+) Transcript_26245:317-571(+)